MNYDNISFERRKLILSASKDIKKFDRRIFEYLCNFQESDSDLEYMISYLGDGFTIGEAEFLLEFSKINPCDHRSISEVKGALKNGFDVADLKFMVDREVNFSEQQFSEILKVISLWQHGEISTEKKNLLINDKLQAPVIRFLCKHIEKVTAPKIEMLVKENLSDILWHIEDIILEGIVVYDFTEEMISFIKEYDSSYEQTAVYELLKAGFPLILINNKFKELCIESSDGMSKRRLIIQALNENVKLDHIKTAINSNDFQKLEKLINEAIAERRKKEINNGFAALCEQFK